MARAATSLALFLSLLFLTAFSHARFINGPIPKPEPESAKEIHGDPETTLSSNSKTEQHATVSFTIDSLDPDPLTLVSLRPIDRRFLPRHKFPLSLPSSLRFGHLRCRHGHRREISYGKDAIVRSSGATTVDRLIPVRWVRIRHGEPRISQIPRADRHLDHHSHHSHHHHHIGEEEKHGEGWFVKKIRKFMNLF